MANFSVEEVHNNFGKALDHLKATATPNDGGVVEATVEALRDLVGHDVNLQKKLADDVNAKLNPQPVAQAAAKPPVKQAAAAPAQHAHNGPAAATSAGEGK